MLRSIHMKKLTALHLEYWRQRRCPTPEWAAGIAAKERIIRIDELINSHLSISEQRFDALSLLSILVSVRRRKASLSEMLARLAEAPGCLINPKRRASYSRKWLKRLKRSPHAQNRVESHRKLLP
jgi:hypothetical protein